jgi:hypothetical protein
MGSDSTVLMVYEREIDVNVYRNFYIYFESFDEKYSYIMMILWPQTDNIIRRVDYNSRRNLHIHSVCIIIYYNY